MPRRECSPEMQANCPLREHFKGWHHLYFPRKAYHGEEKIWREQEENGRMVCRFIHEAIHKSGYMPEHPSQRSVERDLDNDTYPRAAQEYEYQLEVAFDYLLEEEARNG